MSADGPDGRLYADPGPVEVTNDAVIQLSRALSR